MWSIPYTGLMSVVECWHAKMCHPRVDEWVGAGVRFHGVERNRSQPTSSAAYHGENVYWSVLGHQKRPHQADVHLVEPLGRDFSWLHRGRLLCCYLATAALLAVLNPGSHIWVDAPPYHPGCFEATGGTCFFMSQAVKHDEKGPLSSTGIKRRGIPVEMLHHRLTPVTWTARSWREEDLAACSMVWHASLWVAMAA